MIVHLVTSKSGLKNSIDSLRRIVEEIHNSENSLARDWIEPAYARYSKPADSPRKEGEWSSMFKDNMEAIAKSDVMIAEISDPSFGVGHQVAVAAQQKKPILVLRHRDADKDSFASGINDGCVVYKEYDDEKSLREIVSKFLEDNDIQSKDMRFNFFIDRQIYNYLRWAAFKTGKTKAEILRDLVQHEIDKQDYRP